jgi:hypothetical protein
MTVSAVRSTRFELLVNLRPARGAYPRHLIESRRNRRVAVFLFVTAGLAMLPAGPSCPVGSRIGALECLDPACVALPPSQSNKDRDVSGLIQTDGSGRRRG